MTAKVGQANHGSPELGRAGELSDGVGEATGRLLKGTAFCLGLVWMALMGPVILEGEARSVHRTSQGSS